MGWDLAIAAGASLLSGRNSRRAAEAASDDTLQVAREAEALNRERYADAQRILSPYIGQSHEAQRQLAAMMGLPDPGPAPVIQSTGTGTAGTVGGVANVPAAPGGGVPEFIPKRVSGRYIPKRSDRSGGGIELVPNPDYMADTGGTDATGATPQLGQDYFDLMAAITPEDLEPGTPEFNRERQRRIDGLREMDQGRRQQAYFDNPAYRRMMMQLDEYGDIIGDPSYDAILNPITEYQELVRAGDYMEPMREYEQLIEEGVDVSTLPGFERMLTERTEAMKQDAATAGGLYSGRRMQAAGDIGGDLQYQLYRDYMGDQRDYAGNMTNLLMDQLNREGKIASSVSGIEMDRLNRFGGLTDARIGLEDQFYTNYMNILQNMASPQTATALATAGMNQGVAQGQQNIAAATRAGQFDLAGTQAQNQMIADLATGIGEMIPTGTTTPPPQAPPPSLNITPLEYSGTATPMQQSRPDYMFTGF